MRTYTTEIQALDPETGEMKSWAGPNVPGITLKDAENYCQQNGLGYCKINGELVAEIPCDEIFKPNWDNMVDYEQIKYN